MSLPPVLAAELNQDFNLLIGLRCILFALYFILFVSSVLSSCFGCCNYCSCWNRQVPSAPDSHDFHGHETENAHVVAGHPAHMAVLEKTTDVVLKPTGHGGVVQETHTKEVVESAEVVVEEKEKHGPKSHKHHKHKH